MLFLTACTLPHFLSVAFFSLSLALFKHFHTGNNTRKQRVQPVFVLNFPPPFSFCQHHLKCFQVGSENNARKQRVQPVFVRNFPPPFSFCQHHLKCFQVGSVVPVARHRVNATHPQVCCRAAGRGSATSPI